MGVLYYKAPPKTSSNGNDFSIWKLTDLKVTKLLVILAFSFFFGFYIFFWSVFRIHFFKAQIPFPSPFQNRNDAKH